MRVGMERNRASHFNLNASQCVNANHENGFPFHPFPTHTSKAYAMITSTSQSDIVCHYFITVGHGYDCGYDEYIFISWIRNDTPNSSSVAISYFGSVHSSVENAAQLRERENENW